MKQLNITVITTVVFSMIMFAAGCGKSTSNPTDSRQSRLIADENHRIKSQVQQLDAQVDKLTKDLAQCNEEKANIQKDADESVNFAMTTVRDAGEEETKGALRDENEMLKAQVQKVQDELKQLKK